MFNAATDKAIEDMIRVSGYKRVMKAHDDLLGKGVPWTEWQLVKCHIQNIYNAMKRKGIVGDTKLVVAPIRSSAKVRCEKKETK
jgi:hypothetical protein